MGNVALFKFTKTGVAEFLTPPQRCSGAAELANPPLANGGRIMNILDPDRYGWTNVRNVADRN